MAKSKVAKKPVKSKVKKKEKIVQLVCPEPCHYVHRVHTHLLGKGCTRGLQPGTSNKPYAFNLAAGFCYTITHKRRGDKRCELKIEQGPFVGCPPNSKKQTAAFMSAIDDLVCDGLTCSIDPCPGANYEADCPNNRCVPVSIPNP